MNCFRRKKHDRFVYLVISRYGKRVFVDAYHDKETAYKYATLYDQHICNNNKQNDWINTVKKVHIK